jgi:putative transposase
LIKFSNFIPCSLLKEVSTTFTIGDDRQVIFFQEKNYEFFINKIKLHIIPNANLVAWCLMPNHFHILIQATSTSHHIVKETPIKINALTEGLRIMLSSYTRAIQKQENKVGSLFQQKTKFKCVDDYLTSAFHYVHQNPYRAGLANKVENYMWSSMKEYVGLADQNLCRQDIAYQFINIDKDRFLIDSYAVIPDDVRRSIEG